MALLLIVPYFLAIVKTILLSFFHNFVVFLDRNNGENFGIFFCSSVNSTNSANFFLESFAKFLISQN
jgi:hypothetical protein